MITTKAISLLELDDIRAIQSIFDINVFDIKEDERGKSKEGVYFLFNGGEIVYVGKSKDIPKRIKVHKKTKLFDMYSCLQIEDEYSRAIYERILINKYLPVHNIDWASMRLKEMQVPF